MSILTNPTGGSVSTRRWTPSHRVTNSLDTVRGKWEERSRDALVEENQTSSSASGSESGRMGTSTSFQSIPDLGSPSRSSSYRPSTPPAKYPDTGPQRTPSYLKRRTMPSPIIASPLSPNTTGVTVEGDSPSDTSFPTTNRIHLPSYHTSFTTPKKPSAPATISEPFLSSRHRATTLDSASSTRTPTLTRDTTTPLPSTTRSFPDPIQTTSTSYLQRRPTSSQGPAPTTPTSPVKPTYTQPPLSAGIAGRRNTFENISAQASEPPSPSKPPSVMSPPTYRSSYMMKKKASLYGDNLTAGRRLGNHLPRIASGDGDETWQEERREEERREEKERTQALRKGRRTRDIDMDDEVSIRVPEPVTPTTPIMPGTNTADGVAGIPGRLKLSRDKTPSAPSSPLPSARLARGLWADTQRHLIQAYEYLCHVGEAQQWMEGCLGEELGFGIVEMDDGLRNGVVLAKLVRAFQGEAVVRKIYEVCRCSTKQVLF